MKTNAELFESEGATIAVATATSSSCALAIVRHRYLSAEQVHISFAVPKRNPRTVKAATMQAALSKLPHWDAVPLMHAAAAADALAELDAEVEAGTAEDLPMTDGGEA